MSKKLNHSRYIDIYAKDIGDRAYEMEFSEYTLIRSMEIMAAKAAQERCVST